MKFLITVPAWTISALIIAYAFLVVYTITQVLKNEQSVITRVAFILLTLFIPFFAVGYLIYNGMKRNNVIS